MERWSKNNIRHAAKAIKSIFQIKRHFYNLIFDFTLDLKKTLKRRAL